MPAGAPSWSIAASIEANAESAPPADSPSDELGWGGWGASFSIPGVPCVERVGAGGGTTSGCGEGGVASWCGVWLSAFSCPAVHAHQSQRSVWSAGRGSSHIGHLRWLTWWHGVGPFQLATAG